MNYLGWSSLIGAISILNSTSNGWSSANITISTLIRILGGWSLVITGIIGYFGYRIADKMKIKWNAEANERLEELRNSGNKEIEKLRAEINQDYSFFKIILDSYSSEFQSTQPNRIKAIETLWENTLLIRRLGGTSTAFYGLFLEKEFNTIYNNEKIQELILKPISSSDIDQILLSVGNVEKCRPFLGEYLWTLFNTYSTLIGRVTLLLYEGIEKKNIKCWHKDTYTRSIIEEVFSEDEKRYIYSMKIGSFKAATNILERKMLYEIAKLVSGELAANNNFDKAVKIQQLLKDLSVGPQSFTK